MNPAETRVQPPPPVEQVASELARIESSQTFRASRRHRALLRHLVERSQAGDTAALKESLIAIEVFGRPASRFDPRSDTIVRVEARRLRRRLERYFATEGRDSALTIDLPVGSYVPHIAACCTPEAAHSASRRARDLVERGEAFLRQPLSRETLERALERFDAALRETPDFVPALVGSGRAWLNVASGWYREPVEASAHAAEALRRAVALDPAQAVAHVLLGALQHQFERDWAAAERSFRRAVAQAPELGFVHSAYGCHLLMRGELERAERHLARARGLDPYYVNTRVHMVNLRIAQSRLADAGAELDALRDLAPESLPALAMAGLLTLVRGDAEAAVELYRSACALAPEHPGCRASLAAALGQAGRLAEADAELAALHTRFGAQAVSPYVLAIVETRCGRPERALEMLARALEQRDPSAIMLHNDPSFAPLRADARWPALVAAARRRRPV